MKRLGMAIAMLTLIASMAFTAPPVVMSDAPKDQIVAGKTLYVWTDKVGHYFVSVSPTQFSGKYLEWFSQVTTCDSVSRTCANGGTITYKWCIWAYSPPSVVVTNGDVAGVVTDFVTKTAISGVTVTLEGTAFTAFTTATGEFTFSNVPAGGYNLKLSHPDYLDKGVPITVTAGNVTDGDSEMNPAVILSTVGNTGWFSTTYPADANGRYAEVALSTPVTIDFTSLAFVKAEMAFDGEFSMVGEAYFAAYMSSTLQVSPITHNLGSWWTGNYATLDQLLGSTFIAAQVPNHYVVDVTDYVKNNPSAQYFAAFRDYAVYNIRLQNIQLTISYR